MMFPKPVKRKKAKRGKKPKDKPVDHIANAHMAWVKTRPCHCCGIHGESDAHHNYHDRYSRKRAHNWMTIPLCPKCHFDLHNSKREWRETYDPDWMIAQDYILASPYFCLLPYD